jgi:DNA-binding Lrp family transcriptional regulator
MIRAYVLIQTRVGKSAAAAVEVRQVPGVSDAQVVSGPYDVIARVESSDLAELKRGVLAPIQAVEWITRTVTCPVLKL